MAINKYTNTQTNRVAGGGGSIRLTIASNAARQTTSTPIRKAYIQCAAGNTGIVKVNVYAAASATLGLQVPEVVDDGAGPLVLEVDDLNALYFYGATNDDTVDILYTK